MTYLDELLAGYRQGLDGHPPQAIQELRTALAETHEPRKRGTLLGLLAKALAIRARISPALLRRPVRRCRLPAPAGRAVPCAAGHLGRCPRQSPPVPGIGHAPEPHAVTCGYRRAAPDRGLDFGGDSGEPSEFGRVTGKSGRHDFVPAR